MNGGTSLNGFFWKLYYIENNHPKLGLSTASSYHIFHCFTIPKCYPIPAIFKDIFYDLIFLHLRLLAKWFFSYSIIHWCFSLCGFLWWFVGIWLLCHSFFLGFKYYFRFSPESGNIDFYYELERGDRFDSMLSIKFVRLMMPWKIFFRPSIMQDLSEKWWRRSYLTFW